jgi:hypothetical protein
MPICKDLQTQKNKVAEVLPRPLKNVLRILCKDTLRKVLAGPKKPKGSLRDRFGAISGIL